MIPLNLERIDWLRCLYTLARTRAARNNLMRFLREVGDELLPELRSDFELLNLGLDVAGEYRKDRL